MNPLEKFALIPLDPNDVNKPTSNYSVAEGNRRICAVKLLTDPQLAPANLRKSFEKIAAGWSPIKSITAALFDDLEEVRVWLDRVHSGLQGGVGRKDWNAEQKARFDGENKNRASQALLDYAEQQGMITPEERSGTITTVTRFINNDVFRELLGLDKSVPEALSRNRPKPEFDTLVRKFMRDLVERKLVHSRMNGPEIVEYARPLNSLTGVTSNRVQSEPLAATPTSARPSVKSKSAKRPDKVRHIQHEDEIAAVLKIYGNEKLISLYYSICSIELDPHTPIVAVGAWSFFETLTCCAGKNDRTSMESFLNKSRLQSFGFGDDTLAMREAIDRIKSFGNTTKHHKISAAFNGDQLNNDIATLKGVILKCVAVAASNPT